jgi:ribonuclease P protein component
VIFLQIKKSAEFKNISLKGKKFSSHTVVLLTKATSEKYFFNALEGQNAREFCRVGYTVSKAVGGAVARNLAKRRLRAIFKKLYSKYCQNHFDYVIIARREISNVDFAKIAQDLEFCLRNIHGSKKE